jgi:hypothetical protein
MASTWRSYQSLHAWLVPQTSGPASSTAPTIDGQFWTIGTPEEITPQASAHMGANQVTGFSSWSTAAGVGNLRPSVAWASVVMPEASRSLAWLGWAVEGEAETEPETATETSAGTLLRRRDDMGLAHLD